MIPSKKNVKEICDKLMQVNPSQIVIDLVQEVIEEIVHSEDTTPDEIGSAAYQCDILLDVYNPAMKDDIRYLHSLYSALDQWNIEATEINKYLGLDPNK